jgi:hypothetical protein
MGDDATMAMVMAMWTTTMSENEDTKKDKKNLRGEGDGVATMSARRR